VGFDFSFPKIIDGNDMQNWALDLTHKGRELVSICSINSCFEQVI